MKPQLKAVHCTLVAVLLIAASLHAQAPQRINYQGKLVIDGEPLNLPKNITFKIYDKDSNLLWVENQPNVERNNGIFNVLLGRFTPLVNALTNKPLFSELGDRYLELQVGSRIFGRIQITSVAYALKANSANALDAPNGSRTNAVFVDNNGNIGIGTANPSLRLHVNGDCDDIIRLSRDSQSQAWHIGVGESGAPGSFFIARANLSRDFNIAPNGNVGVGTTNPTEKLDVQGGKLRVTNTQIYDNEINRYGSDDLYIQYRNAATGEIPGGNTILNANGGNVGIGTADPLGELDITTTGVNDPQLAFNNDVGSEADISYHVNRTLTSLMRIGKDANGATWDFQQRTPNFQSRLFISGDGNIGIGTTNPFDKLHVVGNILATGSITPGSSREFKENIVDLPSHEAVAAFAKLNPVKFTYKADEKKDLHIGFIAEEVPELLATPDRKGVNPMDVIAVLTKVMQEQQKEIAALREEVKNLKQRQ
jgi:hypothetical protein